MRGAPNVQEETAQWLWILLSAGFAVIFVLVLRHHDDSKKTAAAPGGGGGRRGLGGPVTLNSSDRKEGRHRRLPRRDRYSDPGLHNHDLQPGDRSLTEVHYREGQMVRKGDPLVDIDPGNTRRR